MKVNFYEKNLSFTFLNFIKMYHYLTAKQKTKAS